MITIELSVKRLKYRTTYNLFLRKNKLRGWVFPALILRSYIFYEFQEVI